MVVRCMQCHWSRSQTSMGPGPSRTGTSNYSARSRACSSACITDRQHAQHRYTGSTGGSGADSMLLEAGRACCTPAAPLMGSILPLRDIYLMQDRWICFGSAALRYQSVKDDASRMMLASLTHYPSVLSKRLNPPIVLSGANDSLE